MRPAGSQQPHLLLRDEDDEVALAKALAGSLGVARPRPLRRIGQVPLRDQGLILGRADDNDEAPRGQEPALQLADAAGRVLHRGAPSVTRASNAASLASISMDSMVRRRRSSS